MRVSAHDWAVRPPTARAANRPTLPNPPTSHGCRAEDRTVSAVLRAVLSVLTVLCCPACPVCCPVGPPAQKRPLRLRKAAATVKIEPPSRCLPQANLPQPTSTPLSRLHFSRSTDRTRRAVAVLRGWHARPGSALRLLQRSGSGFVYDEETYQTARQPRMTCCLQVLRPHGMEQPPGAVLPAARAGDQPAARVRAVRTISPPYPAHRASS